MALPLFNSIASWWLKKRIHQIELFLKYPGDVQYEVLQKLLDQAQQTEYGRRFDYGSIRNYEDFRARIPVVHYEDIADTIDRTRKGEQQLFGHQISSGSLKVVEQLMPRANLFPSAKKRLSIVILNRVKTYSVYISITILSPNFSQVRV